MTYQVWDLQIFSPHLWVVFLDPKPWHEGSNEAGDLFHHIWSTKWDRGCLEIWVWGKCGM